MEQPISYIISLPIADRRRSMDFYLDTFNLEPVGEPAEDGVPEPLQFSLGDTVALMLIPSGGFGWVLGDRPIAPDGTSECILGTSYETPADVDEALVRATSNGGEVLTAASQEEWGYSAICADPDGHAWQITAGEDESG